MYRSNENVSAIAVSPTSTGWLSLLYKDGLGKASAADTHREFWFDDAGTLHILCAFVDKDGQVIAANSKHFQLSNVELEIGQPAVASTSRNWVDVRKATKRKLVINEEGACSLVLITSKPKGDIMDVFTGKFHDTVLEVSAPAEAAVVGQPGIDPASGESLPHLNSSPEPDEDEDDDVEDDDDYEYDEDDEDDED